MGKRKFFLALVIFVIISVIFILQIPINLDATRGLKGHKVYDAIGDYVGCNKPGTACVPTI
jgi:hypothetical protein